MKNQVLRIIGGKYRGRKFSFPDLSGLRPTSDRVRETVFNWLMHDVHQATVLDAFAGSGALGFEAASRGASEVVMVEKAKLAANTLRQHIKAWQMDNISILNQDALAYLANTKQQFDIIFIDPPFDSELLQPAISLINLNRCLSPTGKLYVELRVSTPFDPGHLVLLKEKRSGQVCYQLWGFSQDLS